MSEYKGIKGFQVQTRTEDPGPTEAQAGDFYYNSSTGQFKTVGSGVGTGTWASGENLNTQRGQGGGTGASLTASILAGGKGPPGGPSVVVEQYNGSSWNALGTQLTGTGNNNYLFNNISNITITLNLCYISITFFGFR